MQSIIISDEDIEKLREYMPDVDELIEKGDLLEFQIAMMCAIDKTLDEDDEATEETIELESVYDKVSYETKFQSEEK